MADQFNFGRVSDGALMKFLKTVAQIAEDGTWSVSLIGGTDISFSNAEVLSKTWAKTVNDSSYLISSARAVVPSVHLTVQYYRGQMWLYSQPHQTNIWQRGPNAFVDGIQIDGPADKEADLKLLDALQRFIPLAPPAPPSDAAPAMDQATLILNRVSTAVAELVEHTSERQRSMDEALDAAAKDAASSLSARRAELEDEYLQHKQALEERSSKLDERARTLDDRENTHVRREIQKGMATLSSETLNAGLMVKSRRSFLQTVTVTAGLAAVLVAAALIQGLAVTYSPSTDSGVLIFAEVRTALLGLGAAALIWFAVRLAASRYRQESRWEHELYRFRLDTERAGFLIEGDLEARRVNDDGLPEVMLDRFSRGLFASGPADRDTQGDSVGSTLAQLLGRAAAVKVGTDGVSVEVDKPAIRRVRRDADRQAGSSEDEA